MLKKIALLLTATVLFGCQTTKITKQEAYPKVYAEKPVAILVVPAINLTTAADATELYATTIAYPLAEAGYYVLSVPFTQKLLQREGVADGEQARNIPMQKYQTLFGADAVLFVTLNSWDTNYYVTGGNVTVSAKFELKSTKTDETLWLYDDIVVHNTSGGSGNLIADMIATAITTALTDYVPIARIVNQKIVTTIPVGKYNKKHGKDGQEKKVIASKVTTTQNL